MIYFVTGASGFIGKRLVRTLLERSHATVYFLMRDPSPERVEPLRKYWHAGAKRAIPLKGDIGKPGLGLSNGDIKTLKSKVDHFFHLAAIYDLGADPEMEMATNIESTRNAVVPGGSHWRGPVPPFQLHRGGGALRGHVPRGHVRGGPPPRSPLFREQARVQEGVRQECGVPWRIYRPGIVVGDSETGEMDKIDGPYYFFGLIKKIRSIVPPGYRSLGSKAAASIWSPSISSWPPPATSRTRPARTASAPTSPIRIPTAWATCSTCSPRLVTRRTSACASI